MARKSQSRKGHKQRLASTYASWGHQSPTSVGQALGAFGHPKGPFDKSKAMGPAEMKARFGKKKAKKEEQNETG